MSRITMEIPDESLLALKMSEREATTRGMPARSAAAPEDTG